MKLFKPFFLLIIVFSCFTVQGQKISLTKKIKAQTILNISKSLRDNYIYLDTAEKMNSFINYQLKIGAYDTIQTAASFASRLTADLLSVYHDGHLSVTYNPSFTNTNGTPDPKIEKDRMLKFRKRVNFGFDKAEILPGNIGYLKIGGFFAPDEAAKEMAIAALRFISNSEVLIIDLRNNMGGDPGMVNFICGFFFKSKTHLNDLYSRKNKSTTQYWTIPDITLKTLNNIPIYILTSNHTFSAGEELAYDLQSQHRATVIGEITGGGAHPVQPFVVGNGFVANIPFARAINPITKSNWETVGVKPDKKVSSDNALNVALEVIKH